MMTVKELIIELKKFDQNKKVYVYNMEYSGFFNVGRVVDINEVEDGGSETHEWDGILIDEGVGELEAKKEKEEE